MNYYKLIEADTLDVLFDDSESRCPHKNEIVKFDKVSYKVSNVVTHYIPYGNGAKIEILVYLDRQETN